MGLPTLLLAFLLAAPQEETIILPAGPVADLVAELDLAATAPLPGPAWPDWSDHSLTGWGGEAPWRRWVELLRAEARAERPDPERRALLALLAKRQDRDPDAWRHLAAAGPAPAVAAVLPALLPGVPDEYLGSPIPLPKGVLLRPALPPATHDPRGSLRHLAGRVMEHRDVRVGATVLMLRVVVEGDGVQVDVTHRSGPAVGVRVVPPEPPGVDIALLYADWVRVANEPIPVLLVPSPDEPVRTLWGRFKTRAERWPAPLPASEGAHAPRGLLVVSVPPEQRDAPLLARFSEALAELFGVVCVLRSAGEAPPTGFLEPTILHLGVGADQKRKLAAMLSLIEAHALAGAAR